MQAVTTIGLDIAKSVFEVHGIDAQGNVIVRRQLKRRYVVAFFQRLAPCLVGIEACASSHHWSRELQALGHTVRPDAAGLREALRQSAEERCRRRRGKPQCGIWKNRQEVPGRRESTLKKECRPCSSRGPWPWATP